MDRWLWGYLDSLRRRPRHVDGTRHLIVAVCDHYEPYRDQAARTTARAYVERWTREYPRVIDPFRDADGCLPRHTFFYPEEEYDPVCLDGLGELMRSGCGEVEIHLHHRHDTPEGLREKLTRFRDLLHREHGMLGMRNAECGMRNPPSPGHRRTSAECGIPLRQGFGGQVPNADHLASDTRHPQYAFIHGNWSLCNARPDGDWCGVNEELGILAETGCYADLTFPSAPSPTQPRMVNAIYRAHDQPAGRGQDRGERVCVVPSNLRSRAFDLLRRNDPTRGLLLIQGPLALNFARRKYGLLPRLENAELSGVNPPGADRIDLWVRAGIHVSGRPEWRFVKLHTHGCVPANSDALLGEPIRRMHATLQARYNDGRDWQLHYVTAREMTNMILAAEAGRTGSPGSYRDFVIAPPPGAGGRPNRRTEEPPNHEGAERTGGTGPDQGSGARHANAV